MKSILQIIFCNLLHALPEKAHLLLRLSHHLPVRFDSSDLYPLFQKMSSTIYCLLPRPSQPRPYIKSPHLFPSSLPISRLTIDHPPPSVYHHLCPFTMSNDRLPSVALGAATSRTPDHRISLLLTIHSATPTVHLRGGFLLERLLRKVRHHLGRSILPGHPPAYSGYLSSRAIHRKTGHVALFGGLHPTLRIVLRCPPLEYPGLRSRPPLRKCAVGQKSLDFPGSLA